MVRVKRRRRPKFLQTEGAFWNRNNGEWMPLEKTNTVSPALQQNAPARGGFRVLGWFRMTDAFRIAEEAEDKD